MLLSKSAHFSSFYLFSKDAFLNSLGFVNILAFFILSLRPLSLHLAANLPCVWFSYQLQWHDFSLFSFTLSLDSGWSLQHACSGIFNLLWIPIKIVFSFHLSPFLIFLRKLITPRVDPDFPASVCLAFKTQLYSWPTGYHSRSPTSWPMLI